MKERCCNVCSTGAIEDETHFLLECKSYTNIRNMYFRNMHNIIQKKYNILVSERFTLKLYFNSNVYNVLRNTVNFIRECFTYRNELLKNT